MKILAKILVLPALALFAAGDAQAQTLYKLVDKNGKVTYVEKVPPGYDGKVVPVTIDPNANRATLPKLEPGSRPADRSSSSGGAPTRSERVEKAKESLEAAKKALEHAQNNPGEDEVARVGNKGGGARPVFSDEYKGRIQKLEAAVKAAEKELAEAEGA